MTPESMALSHLRLKFILLLSLILIGFSILNLNSRFAVIRLQNKELVIFEPGYQYSPFVPFLKNVEEAGFLTNKETKPENGYEELLQAQYMLAPCLLHLNKSDFEYNVLDYANQIYVFYLLNQLNADHISDTDWGRVLIKRKP